MINFKTYTYLLVFSILTFSCKASPQQDKKYPSLATDLHKYHLNGPVKMMRCYMDFKEDGLTKDQIKLNDAQGVVNITGSGKGYFKFNNNGMMVKYHGLPDSINQVLNDTIRIYKKGAGVENIYIYIYIYIMKTI